MPLLEMMCLKIWRIFLGESGEKSKKRGSELLSLWETLISWGTAILPKINLDSQWLWLKSHSLKQNSNWFSTITLAKISKVMFSGNNSFKTLTKSLGLKNCRKRCQMRNWALARHHSIMESDQSLRMNWQLQIESSKVGRSFNYQTGLMWNNSLKTGTNSTDSKSLKSNSDKFWPQSDSICPKNKAEPFANCMPQMMRRNQKWGTLISWRTPNLMTSRTWLMSSKLSNTVLDKGNSTQKMSNKFLKNSEGHRKLTDSDTESISRTLIH